MGEVVRLPQRHDAPTEPFVKEDRVAAHFDVEPRTVRRWRVQGMPSHKSRNGARRYRVAECEAWWHARNA